MFSLRIRKITFGLSSTPLLSGSLRKKNALKSGKINFLLEGIHE